MPATKKKTQKTKSRAKKSPARAKKAPKKKVVPKKAAARKPRVAKPAKKRAPAPKKKAAEKRPRVSFRKELTEKLLADKRRVLAEVAHKVKSESEGSKSEIGDIYDIASSERERELYLTLGDREREKLSEIENALERIKDKSYGECEECGEPIGENRLRALPFTRVCVDCKSRSEREEHVRGRIVEEAAVGMMEKSEAEEEEL
jgi:DnaK suppressor protein